MAAGIPGLDSLVNTLFPGVQALGAPRRLPLLEMCLPALKSMSGAQYRVFKHTRLGVNTLDLTGMTLLPRAQSGVAAFSRAVHEPADCFPLLKPRLLKAMALVAGHEGTLNPVEREVIASVAAVMDCPVPSLPDHDDIEPAPRI